MKLIDAKALFLVFTESIVQSSEADAEFGGGGGAVAVVSGEGGEDGISFELIESGRGVGVGCGGGGMMG